MLASFNAPKTSSGPAPSSSTYAPGRNPPAAGSAPPTGAAHAGDAADAAEPDFDAALMEGMESLLRQLAGNAGIMPDLPADPSGASGFGAGTAPSVGEDKGKDKMKALSPEEEEEAWQRAVESVLSGEGLKAMGLNDPSVPTPSGTGTGTGSGSGNTAAAAPPATSGAAKAEKPSFDDTIRRTMESLKSGGSNSAKLGGAGAGAGSAGAGLEEFLRQMGHDPAALDALGGLEGLEGLDGDDDIGGLLDGMMSQLMNKEILEEPMSELEAKVSLSPFPVAPSYTALHSRRKRTRMDAQLTHQYPAYLASPPSDVSPGDLEKYKQQHALVKQILAVFRKPNYSDAEDGKEIARLVGEMQDLGGPPKEIMGDMPEGFVSSWLRLLRASMRGNGYHQGVE